jgi:hypothetical protein
MPSTPYVSAAAFRAHPTYLDTGGLRVDTINGADQTAELTNILLMASAWADNEADQPLGAHLYTQYQRVRCDQSGMVRLHADHTPALAVASLGYGLAPQTLTTLDNPQAWIEAGATLVLTLGATTGAWSGSLQFGSPATGSEIFAQTSIVSGWVATVGATSVTVADPTGILPGSTYRIWEPGAEETVTVSPLWLAPTPTAMPAPAAVTLASPTLFAHTTGHDLSSMPADLRLAVTMYATAALMRPDSTAEDEYPDTALSSNTRGKDPRRTGAGLISEARKIVSSYARIR